MIDANLGITVARRRLKRFSAMHPSARPDVVVFSDVRFENEAAMIQELGGRIVHIRRAGSCAVNLYPSEAGARGGDGEVVVNNDFGVDYLRDVAKHFVT